MLTSNRVNKILDAFFQGPLHAPFSADRLPHPRVWKDKSSIVFELDLPGQSAENIEVTSERNTIQVRWKPLEKSEGSARFQEIDHVTQGIEFKIPFKVDPERTSIVQKNGILRIQLSKPEQEVPQKLTVKNA